MMTAPDNIASAKYGPLSRKVGKPISSEKATATSMPAGSPHHGPKPMLVLRNPAA